jgi:hypothetical protein
MTSHLIKERVKFNLSAIGDDPLWICVPRRRTAAAAAAAAAARYSRSMKYSHRKYARLFTGMLRVSRTKV